MSARPLRVAVWSTGGVGARAIEAIRHRPDLQLTGVWVHSPDKAGRDAGELAGGAPIGILATADAEALISEQPDCVIYAASGPERDAAAVRDYGRFLSAGINVVTTTSTQLIYPPVFIEAWRSELESAAVKGGASLYASGIFPGFASDQLALLLSTMSSRIERITARELSLNDHYPVANVMMDGLGFGRPLDFEPWIAKPGAIASSWQAPIRLMAEALGWQVDEIRGYLDREPAMREIDVAFGTIAPGTCGAVRTRAAGVVAGREALVVEHVIRMARDVAPDWPSSSHDATYGVTIEGTPSMECTLTLGDAVGHGAGDAAMTATAMRVVNAVPFVVAAAPGLISSLDLPVTLPRHALAAA